MNSTPGAGKTAEAPTVVDMTKLTLQQLNEHLAAQVAAAVGIKNNIDALKGEITRRLTPQAKALFDAKGKEHGDVTFEEGGLKFKATVDRKVKWDSPQLQKIAATMPWSAVERLFKIEFSVAEATFKAILDDDLRKKLEAARTTENSDMKITPVTTKD